MLKSILKLLGLIVLYILGGVILLIHISSFRYFIPSILLPASYATILLLVPYIYIRKIAPIAVLTKIQEKVVTIMFLLFGALSIYLSIMLVAVGSTFVAGLGGTELEYKSFLFLTPILITFNFIFNLLAYKSFDINISSIRVFIYLVLLQIPSEFLYFLISKRS